MKRLVEIEDVRLVGPSITLSVGDVLLFNGTGGHVQSGDDILEYQGALLRALPGHDGTILTPAGAPNAVLFRARAPGQARIDVIKGDPWHRSEATILHVNVEANSVRRPSSSG
jgi:hypothetical protein